MVPYRISTYLKDCGKEKSLVHRLEGQKRCCLAVSIWAVHHRICQRFKPQKCLRPRPRGDKDPRACRCPTILVLHLWRYSRRLSAEAADKTRADAAASRSKSEEHRERADEHGQRRACCLGNHTRQKAFIPFFPRQC